LLTCTLGEFGEILVPALAELAADRGDQLGGYRMHELAGAMRALGVTDHRFLGGASRFHDSGMMGTPGNEDPRGFWRGASEPDVFAAAVAAAVDVIRDVRPQVVVTYDEKGGYGHPDHIMAHRVTMAAVDAAGDPSFAPRGREAWSVAKVYWNVSSRSSLLGGLEALRGAGTTFLVVDEVNDFPFAADDSTVTTVVDASGFVSPKTEAMRAHATQILVDPPFFALSNQIGQLIRGVEEYRLVRGEAGPLNDNGHETDLFAGVA
jgi:N-acetyl-1-D-myo-inositol-2-amino-2-deoxy-alpha-D-glucopyranoside deacetylase